MSSSLACPVDIGSPWSVHVLLVVLTAFLAGRVLRSPLAAVPTALAAGTALLHAFTFSDRWRGLHVYLWKLRAPLKPGKFAADPVEVLGILGFCVALPAALAWLAHHVARRLATPRRESVEP